MYNNPYSDETVNTQAHAYPPIDELQLKPQAQTYPTQAPPVTDAPRPAADAGSGQEGQSQPSKAMTAKFVIGKFTDYLVWLVTVLETMLALRFLLKLIGADPGNLFASFLFAVTEVMLLPFLGIVSSPSINKPNQSFEFSTLIAMLIYYLMFYAFRRFVRLLISNPEDPVE